MLGIKEKLKEVMTYFDETFPKLAVYLGISYQALNKKLNGQSDFKLGEIIKIKERYNLSMAEIEYIFFDSCTIEEVTDENTEKN